jgi:hypothetical protein
VDLVPHISFLVLLIHLKSPVANLGLTLEWRKDLYTSEVVVGETNHMGYVN